ncbi:uncharacterized protein VTP21DRAFT_620 [Calcarisporiella thermophila]|uniref:uncharacterized protein n=1 Tax=Calcarisporiella thermophila TaxID=911321 RepID=UPI0037439090
MPLIKSTEHKPVHTDSEESFHSAQSATYGSTPDISDIEEDKKNIRPEEDSETEERHEEDADSEDDEDAEDLLKKAEEALAKRQEEMMRLEDETEEQDRQIPKLESGIDLNTNLYIKRGGKVGVARLETGIMIKEKAEGSIASMNTLKRLEKSNGEQRPSNKDMKEERGKTSGSSWFDMPKPDLTPELKRDLQVLKLRNVIDPKRHYKKEDTKTIPKYFQVGTIVEGPTEFYSSRMTRKERKRTIVDEVMGDGEMRKYYKRKFLEVQETKQSGGKKDKRKAEKQKKAAWKTAY